MSGRFNLGDYVTVDERIDRFWADYPDGAIRTELIYTNNDGSSVAVRAAVHKVAASPQPDATGIAQEDRLTGLDQYGKPVKGANTTSWWENCETSAIGRALANLGMSLSKQRPSREEMQKVERYDQRQRDPDDDLPEYVPPRATSAPRSNGTAPARMPTPPAAQQPAPPGMMRVVDAPIDLAAPLPVSPFFTASQFKRTIDRAHTLVEDGEPYARIVHFLNVARPSMTPEQKEEARLELPKLQAKILERDQPAPAEVR